MSANDKQQHAFSTAHPMIDTVRKSGLAPGLLYETVIELADEGMLTAGWINSAATILLTELGLPAYFFKHISKRALKRVLHAIATHMRRQDGRFVLSGELAEVRFDVDGGVQARIATAETRDRMEAMLEQVMPGNRVGYYCSREHQYYTYIIFPERCPELREVRAGASPFAFAAASDDPSAPPETQRRYEAFLRRCAGDVTPLVEVMPAPDSGETRIMFRDDFSRSALPVMRKLLGDLNIFLSRAYWETYRGDEGRIESVCSLYLLGEPPRRALDEALRQLRALLALGLTELDQLYVGDALNFEEYLFAVNAAAFVHDFIYKDLDTDRLILDSLDRADLRAAMAQRVFNSNRAEYTRKLIRETLLAHPELIKTVFAVFDRKFNPRFRSRPVARAIGRRLDAFRRRVAIAFIDDTTGCDIFSFMARFVSDVLKTNFYRERKRAFAFRLDPRVLDPLVYPGRVFGIFFVVGFYAVGTHMRAEDVARGGLRLIRVTPGSYETDLDNMPLLNYALGPVAQRLKHKDIAESGAKGVIVPRVEYAQEGLRAVYDFTDGIMDLLLPADDVVDHLGRPEMIFFGPDEGTAHFMDAVAERARDRGYKHWRTITTGKTIGIPHDTYGLTTDRRVFGLIARGEKGTELQLDGKAVLVAADAARIVPRLEKRVAASGMTTMGIMATLRTTLAHLGLAEDDLSLMMTGGPDGDLGANQIQSWHGRISLVIDGGAVLFDPDGLDRRELLKLACARHTEPRLNSLAYPDARLSAGGFKAPRTGGRLQLPDGAAVDDGAFFHRHFLTNAAMRKHIEQANIQVFVPCGGVKDMIHAGNVRDFLAVFAELKVIVEGANVFFDEVAREVIARETSILQIKDSSANKGGVTSSSVAEVLTAFLLGDDYEKYLVHDAKTKARLIYEVFDLISGNAVAETKMLLELHRKHGTPLSRLSIDTSEQLYALQTQLYDKLDRILVRPELVRATLSAYVPDLLVDLLGMKRIQAVLDEPELTAYRDAILTKKLAATALYKHAADWDAFLGRLERDFEGELATIMDL